MALELSTIGPPLLGGVLIGLASIGLLLFNGRIAGISGIVDGAMVGRGPERGWRLAFIGGLLVGGVVLMATSATTFFSATPASIPVVILAGFLVGFGTRLGSGCTSGHGVCGLSRLSPRSLVATLSFIIAGMVTVASVRMLIGGAA